jgi:hypothetical protein
MLSICLWILLGFVLGVCATLLLPNTKYKKLKAEFDELKEKAIDKIDGDDDDDKKSEDKKK